MGGDMVIFCDEVNGVQLYWNVALSDSVKYSAPVGDNVGIVSGSVTSDGLDYIQCDFTRDASVTFPTPTTPSRIVTFDLDTTAYYSLSSVGMLNPDTDMPDKHSSSFVSEEIVDFTA